MMFKKIRLRFILLTMASVLAVLLVIMGTINILNYKNAVQESDRILDLLAENEGRFPAMQGPENAPPAPRALPPGGETGGPAMTAETPFESRFFSVLLDADGQVLETDIDNIAAVDEESADNYALGIFEKGKARGFLSNYRYLRSESDAGTRIIFLDCTRAITSWRSFLGASILVSLIGFGAVMLLVILFSSRIVRPLRESYEKQRRFITDASHELKTPLTVIDADLSVLQAESGESEWIDDARAQTKRLAKLTNDLVYLSRMDEEQRQVDMIDFSLSDLVSEEAQSCRARALLEEKQFTSEIEGMLSYRGDEKALRQLVSILLDNALKYSDEGGWIRVSLQQSARGPKLVVSNSCKAIEKDALPHLFDRFYRTDESRSSKTGGYGLGLSIARAIVDVHKGKISAASPDGKSLSISAQL